MIRALGAEMASNYPQTTNDPWGGVMPEGSIHLGRRYPEWVGFGKQNRRGGFIRECGKGAKGGPTKIPERRRSIPTAGLWSWKSKSAKKCVTTYPPNRSALKMDGAQAPLPYPYDGDIMIPIGRRRTRVGGAVSMVRTVEDPPSVQISVVVASTQGSVFSLRVEEGKGSTGTEVVRG